MKVMKNTIKVLGLLTITTLTYTSTTNAAAILHTPSSPLAIVSNGGGVNIDVNNDGVDDLFIDSTYSNSPYGGTETMGTATVTDDIHYQGTSEITQMSISALSGQTTYWAYSYGWLMDSAELGAANQDIYYQLLGSEENCNYDYSQCDYYDDNLTHGIMEFDMAGYIGFTFDINGDSHWGWLYADRSAGLTVESWGWESNANIQINAGYGTSVVPVPAAVWLFGSGLIGLIGFARRKASI